jgi:hypothetical protein
MRRILRRLVATLVLGLAAIAAPAGAAPACPQAATTLHAPLPHLARALASGAPVGIVLVGIGGSRAEGPEGPFAQTLAKRLERGFGGHEVRVQYVPTPGMLAKDSAERVRRAATEAEPALVIWRTGMADALAMTDPAKFGNTVRRVAEWLSVQSADLVLVDLAYHAGSAQEANYRRYVDALAEVGRGAEAPVFRRYAIMEAWARAGATPSQPAAAESCLAEALAAAVLQQAGR